MTTPGTRLLQLLSLLQSRRHWSGEELAGRLEVSTRTLRWDVERLRELGYPVEAQRGVDGGYQSAAGAVLPPLLLDDEEAVAIGVGLHSALQAGSITGIEESSVRALGEVIQVMPTRLRRRIDALATMTVPAPWQDAERTVDADVLVAVAQACRDGERLKFADTTHGGDIGTREVDPHRVVLTGRRWYRVAWDLTRFDWRTFRLDRLVAPLPTGQRAMPRQLPAGDAGEFVRSGIRGAPQRYQVNVVLFASAATVRARIGPWGELDEMGPARCRLRMNSDALDWPTLLLGRAATEFEVSSPEELVDHLLQCAAHFGRSVDRHPGR